MMSSCERSGLPAAADSSSTRELWPASKSRADECTSVKGLITRCQDSFTLEPEIWPCRVRICQSPRLDWKMPMALARRTGEAMPSKASAAFRKLVMDSLLRLGNSEKTEY